MSLRDRVVVSLVIASLAALLLFHFTIIVLYNSRPNPIKLRHARFINRYMEPLFGQDWHLFSPQPVNFDVILLLKVRGRDTRTGRTTESNWLDITSPILQRLHETRFSSLGSLAHIHALTFFGRSPGPSTVEVLKLACGDNPQRDVCQAALKAQKETQGRVNRLLTRVGSAHASKLFGGWYELQHVKIRTLIRRFPRFSQRAMNARATFSRYDESPWLAYERTDAFR